MCHYTLDIFPLTAGDGRCPETVPLTEIEDKQDQVSSQQQSNAHAHQPHIVLNKHSDAGNGTQV